MRFVCGSDRPAWLTSLLQDEEDINMEDDDEASKKKKKAASRKSASKKKAEKEEEEAADEEMADTQASADGEEGSDAVPSLANVAVTPLRLEDLKSLQLRRTALEAL